MTVRGVCELLKRQTTCLKIWLSYGLLTYGHLHALSSVSKSCFDDIYFMTDEV